MVAHGILTCQWDKPEAQVLLPNSGVKFPCSQTAPRSPRDYCNDDSRVQSVSAVGVLLVAWGWGKTSLDPCQSQDAAKCAVSLRFSAILCDTANCHIQATTEAPATMQGRSAALKLALAGDFGVGKTMFCRMAVPRCGPVGGEVGRHLVEGWFFPSRFPDLSNTPAPLPPPSLVWFAPLPRR